MSPVHVLMGSRRQRRLSRYHHHQRRKGLNLLRTGLKEIIEAQPIVEAGVILEQHYGGSGVHSYTVDPETGLGQFVCNNGCAYEARSIFL